MTDPTILATLVTTGIVTVVAALTSATVTIINALAAARDRKTSVVERRDLTATARATEAKADTLLVKSDEIHDLTNSNLTAVKAELVAANLKVAKLERVIVDLTKKETDR